MKTAGTCCFKKEAASSSETMVPFFEIVLLHIPEVSYLHCTLKIDHKLLTVKFNLPHSRDPDHRN